MSMLTTNEPIVAQPTILESTAGKILTVSVNLVVLTELCIAMFFAAQNPDSLTEVFFKVFLSLLLPTLVLSAFAKRYFITRKIR